MARKDTTTWFRHDCNAKDDVKCVLLIEQLGLEGYGIFWVLIEVLRDQPEYKYPISLLPALARRYNTTTEKLKTVVFSYDLFQVQGDDFFYSESLLVRMHEYDRIKAAIAENGKKGGIAKASKAIARLEQGYSKALANPSDKNIIDKNRIEDNRIDKINLNTKIFKPNVEDIDKIILPEIKANSVIMLVSSTRRQKIELEQVYSLFEVFKIQNFTGDKEYKNEAAIHTHFINWAKMQDFEAAEKKKQKYVIWVVPNTGSESKVTVEEWEKMVKLNPDLKAKRYE